MKPRHWFMTLALGCLLLSPGSALGRGPIGIGGMAGAGIHAPIGAGGFHRGIDSGGGAHRASVERPYSPNAGGVAGQLRSPVGNYSGTTPGGGRIFVRGPVVNSTIYGWPFGAGGVGGWGGPLWWAIGYPGWGIYDQKRSGYASVSPEQAHRAADFISLGSQAFRAARYDDALRNWQHALIDDPAHGEIVLLIAQALFALGRYDDAAGSVQLAMEMLSERQWGSVMEDYAQLYSNVDTYTNQLRSLETARDENPRRPAVRFLLGYHYGYLGYPQHAIHELDQVLQLEPRDASARRLRDLFARQLVTPLPALASPTHLGVSREALNALGLGNGEPMTDAEGHYVRGFGTSDRGRD